MLDPNHPEWKGFVASMREEPANDTIRLAFADWVEERGGAAFALLIRSMVKVAESDPNNLLSVSGWDKKTWAGNEERFRPYRDAELAIKSVWAQWSPVKDLYPDARNEWRFHRGYPDKVVIDWRGLKWLDTLCAIGPVGEVIVVGGSRVSSQVYATTIQFSLDDPHLHTRVKSPYFILMRKDVLVGNFVPLRSNLRTQVATHFLNEIWGDKVTRIRYEPRQLKVWPDEGLNAYQYQ